MDLEIRFGTFLFVLLVLLARERLVPAFAPPTQPLRRIWTNAALALTGVLASRLLAPAGVAAVAVYAERKGLGVLNVLEVAAPAAGLVTILVLDLAVYWQHRLMHRVPLLWRLHAVHHADPHIDVTTAVRFHPAEIALSLLLKSVVVLALGGPAWAVIAFEALLAAAALFNHANTRFSRGLERALRRVVVTPDLHRVHHAHPVACRDRNFGFSITLWDRLFGTYREPEQVGVPIDRFGLDGVAAESAASLRPMLTLAWRGRL